MEKSQCLFAQESAHCYLPYRLLRRCSSWPAGRLTQTSLSLSASLLRRCPSTSSLRCPPRALSGPPATGATATQATTGFPESGCIRRVLAFCGLPATGDLRVALTDGTPGTGVGTSASMAELTTVRLRRRRLLRRRVARRSLR